MLCFLLPPACGHAEGIDTDSEGRIGRGFHGHVKP
jgi:hypothetical protein